MLKVIYTVWLLIIMVAIGISILSAASALLTTSSTIWNIIGLCLYASTALPAYGFYFGVSKIWSNYE